MTQRNLFQRALQGPRFFTYSAISCCRLVSSVGTARGVADFWEAKGQEAQRELFQISFGPVPLLDARPSAAEGSRATSDG